MLLENFYEVLELKEIEDTKLLASVKINDNHQMFKGHFPNQPITPGVAMLQILKNCLELHFKNKLFMKSSSNVKFLALVEPSINSELNFNIQFEENQNQIKVKNLTSFNDHTAVLKCNATFVKLT
ncbi:3-hydroxyacyl-ACP dehydratase [Winogradskyella ursingii]|uniref:3-hydroxyacyl-ACP dehydratase n=1 Tax=Winogradskyella ursingii TaxID=2686079 RepID=UPI0015CB620C|nr:3-hydroxyacyl-ACP dehydratase [Winogradskyella ursingii]